MLRSGPSSKSFTEKSLRGKDSADGKAPSDGAKWRRGWSLKSLLLGFTFIMFSLVLLSNFFVDPLSSAFWNWGVPSAVIEPRTLKVKREPVLQRDAEPRLQKCSGGPRLGKDLLPKGIAQTTSDLQLQPLGKNRAPKVRSRNSKVLLAIAAGIKQKHYVDRIVRKFLESNSTVILFHYDGVVDKWNDYPWSLEAVHIAAVNQTKWWFAKRFLHPDIVAPYDYLFVWDEDLGVENFHLNKYLAIIQDEDLQISQPALDSSLSEVHHRITIRNKKARVHRRSLKPKGRGKLCFQNSTDPPCTGWVEGMAPVFVRDAWKCVWHLIQNDLVHGWGLDFKLGYCVKGDRSRKVGVVDSEYVVHRGIPSLGGPALDKMSAGYGHDARSEVRRRSSAELNIFSRRWQKAVTEDECWRDPYKHDPDYYPTRSRERRTTTD